MKINKQKDDETQHEKDDDRLYEPANNYRLQINPPLNFRGESFCFRIVWDKVGRISRFGQLCPRHLHASFAQPGILRMPVNGMNLHQPVIMDIRIFCNQVRHCKEYICYSILVYEECL